MYCLPDLDYLDPCLSEPLAPYFAVSDRSRQWAEAMLSVELQDVHPATPDEVRTFLLGALPKALPLDAQGLATLRLSGATEPESRYLDECGDAVQLAHYVGYVSLCSKIGMHGRSTVRRIKYPNPVRNLSLHLSEPCAFRPPPGF